MPEISANKAASRSSGEPSDGRGVGFLLRTALEPMGADNATFRVCPQCQGAGKTGLFGDVKLGLMTQVCRMCRGSGHCTREELPPPKVEDGDYTAAFGGGAAVVVGSALAVGLTGPVGVVTLAGVGAFGGIWANRRSNDRQMGGNEPARGLQGNNLANSQILKDLSCCARSRKSLEPAPQAIQPPPIAA